MTSSSLLYPSSHQGTSDSRLPLVTCDRRGEGAGFSGRSLSEAPTRWRAADWTEVCRQAWAHRVTGSQGHGDHSASQVRAIVLFSPAGVGLCQERRL